MPRKLSEAEREYVVNHLIKGDMTIEQIANKIDGVGVKTIKKIAESLPVDQEEPETVKERHERLRESDFQTGKLMGRHKRGKSSSVIMTQAASEMADALIGFLKNPKPFGSFPKPSWEVSHERLRKVYTKLGAINS